MTLTDPREALADQSSFIGYLVGLAGLGRTVRSLTTDGGPQADCETTDFVLTLLGLASLGDAIERLAEPVQQCSMPATVSTTTRWLR